MHLCENISKMFFFNLFFFIYKCMYVYTLCINKLKMHYLSRIGIVIIHISKNDSIFIFVYFKKI